ncbi:repressor LexA [Patescibacteria group bacterium]|nr:MAG: repressor LexA [Patescibacteria group bacterium]
MRKEEQKTKIIDFYKKHKRMPGYKEIMQILGFKSKNSVHKLIGWLVEQGIVSKDSRGKIVPKRIESEIPLVGLVEAGLPADADEIDLDTVSLEDFLVEDRARTYILEVKGDSMIDAHIDEGDYVLAERRGEARDRDIVIAEIDGGWTMKYFRKQGNKVWLEPANKRYKPIYPRESFRVAAVVKAVIRKY